MFWTTCISGGGLGGTRGLTLACTFSVTSRIGEEDLFAERLERQLKWKAEEMEKAREGKLEITDKTRLGALAQKKEC